ncbi:hypothetical protein AB0H83_32020 [Dactylosporangium sp. NPDC050688]|uniref:hypothetical protein n=1 Tax=Dactylosporangium sp. NPDC050688 TaxID=3157217 RepID=UPI00340706E7
MAGIEDEVVEALGETAVAELGGRHADLVAGPVEDGPLRALLQHLPDRVRQVLGEHVGLRAQERAGPFTRRLRGLADHAPQRGLQALLPPVRGQRLGVGPAESPGHVGAEHTAEVLFERLGHTAGQPHDARVAETPEESLDVLGEHLRQIPGQRVRGHVGEGVAEAVGQCLADGGAEQAGEVPAEALADALAEAGARPRQRPREQAADDAELDGLHQQLVVIAVAVALADLDALDDPVHRHAGDDTDDHVLGDALEQPPQHRDDELAGDDVLEGELEQELEEPHRRHEDRERDLDQQLDELSDDHVFAVLGVGRRLLDELADLAGRLSQFREIVRLAAGELRHRLHERIRGAHVERLGELGDALVEQFRQRVRDALAGVVVDGGERVHLVGIHLRPLHARQPLEQVDDLLWNPAQTHFGRAAPCSVLFCSVTWIWWALSTTASTDVRTPVTTLPENSSNCFWLGTYRDANCRPSSSVPQTLPMLAHRFWWSPNTFATPVATASRIRVRRAISSGLAS